MSSKPKSQILQLQHVRQFNIVVYGLALVALFVGVALMFAEHLWRIPTYWFGFRLIAAGILLLVPMFFEKVFLLPQLECPHCGQPYFVFTGIAALFQYLPGTNRTCVHCHAPPKKE